MMYFELFLEYYMSPSTISVFLHWLVILLLAFTLHYAPRSNFSLLFQLLYEKTYDFFADVLWETKASGLLTYCINLFFIILLFNLLGVAFEFIAPIFGFNAEGKFILEWFVSSASSDIHFNLAMAIISILLVVGVQFSSLWLKDFFKNYFPIFGNAYVEVEKEGKHPFVYYALYIPVKMFDITLSMFLWILELVWMIAKIISLSFRLFGNMTSGTVLLAMSVVAMSAMTTDWIGVAFPVGIPVIIYLQEILIGSIQAIVFSLLVAIFLRIAKYS